MSETSNDLTGSKPTAASTLERAIGAASDALLAQQRPDGHWVFELEADATIPAEYVLLRHYLGEPVDAALEQKIAVYLRRIQGAHGGWPLFRDGDLDVSATVKAYFALKLIGNSVDADHMRRAREALRARGGAERVNVFTRIMLALFGFIPWRAVPMMPVEIMLLPKWFPIHLDKMSYWSRTVIVPLLVLMAKRPVARNAKGVRIDELFLGSPADLGPAPKAPQQKASWFWLFRGVDNVLRVIEPLLLRRLASRQRAIDRAVAWVGERLNGEDGLGAIFPAMANSVMMYRRPRLSGNPPAARHRAQVGGEAPRRARARSLLPTVRLADLGYRRLPATRCSKPAASARQRRSRRASTGWCRCRFSMCAATGSRGGRTYVPAAGRSNMPTRIIPTSTIPPSSPWPWTACRKKRAAKIFAPRSNARASGSSACRARTAPGVRSMPTTSSTT